MRASLRPVLAVAALAFAAAPAVRADDPAPAAPAAPKTYKVLLRERWKAGDVVTRSARESSSRSVEIHAGGETQKPPTSERQTSYVVVTKCLEADADGYPTKMILYLTARSIEVGPEKDSSLSGLHIQLDGKGADRTWKILTPDAAPSDFAKGWFDQTFGKKSASDATNADLEPKAEVAVGGTWEGDGVSIGKRLAERGLPVDVEKSKASGTLVGVEGTTAHVEVKMTLPTKEFNHPNGQKLPWKEGGAYEYTVDLVRPLVAGEFDAKVKREIRWAGVAGGDEGTITWDDVTTQAYEISTGGRMPDVPAAKAPADGERKEPTDAPKPDTK